MSEVPDGTGRHVGYRERLTYVAGSFDLTSVLRDLEPSWFHVDVDPTALGVLLESFVLEELMRSLPLQADRCRLRHCSDLSRKREIDIIAEIRDRLVAFEIEACRSVAAKDLKHRK